MLCRHNTAKDIQIRKGFPEQGKCPQHHIPYETTETPRAEINVLYDHRQVKNSCFLAHKSLLVLIIQALKLLHCTDTWTDAAVLNTKFLVSAHY